jgi:hypothetical protein
MCLVSRSTLSKGPTATCTRNTFTVVSRTKYFAVVLRSSFVYLVSRTRHLVVVSRTRHFVVVLRRCTTSFLFILVSRISKYFDVVSRRSISYYSYTMNGVLGRF